MKRKTIIPSMTLLFGVLAPLTTFGLLWMKGFPDFAQAYPGQILGWVYSVSILPSLTAGAILGSLAAILTGKTSVFQNPFDLGRCLSLGGVSGALLLPAAEWSFRQLVGRQPNPFWSSGSILAGCITGACVAAAVLWFTRPASSTPS